MRGPQRRYQGGPRKGPWSKGRDLDIRNVEAVGSNPITSTKSPGQRAKVGSPCVTKRPERYVEVIGLFRDFKPNVQVKG
jgi:hypothetical protein